MRCSDSPPSVGPRFVAFAWPYRGRARSIRSPGGRTHHPKAWTIDDPEPSRDRGRGNDGASQVPGEPVRIRALLFDPGVSLASGLYDARADAFRSSDTVGLHHFGRFRGSFTRPASSLSTLRSAPRDAPRKTRYRLAANLGRTGLDTRWAPTVGFRDAPST